MKRTNRLLLITAWLWLAGCGSQKPENAATPPLALAIQTARVESRTVSSELTIPASIQPDPSHVVHVFAPVSGRLIELRVKPGDAVRSGQALAVIQSSDAAGALSDYQKAKAAAEHSGSALRRASLLYQHEVIAQKDLEDAKAQAASDESELARTRQRLHMLGLSESAASDQVTVVATHSGVVTETTSAPGEMSKSLDASNPLLTIADLSSIWVVGNVYERDLSLTPSGLAVRITLDAYPGENWQGKISRISDVVDPNTHTLKLRVVLNNPGRKLKPDMFAAIHVLHPATRVAVIPSSALLHEGNQAFVMVQKGEDKFEKRAVQVQESNPETTQVLSGLQPGEMVVTSGADLIRNREEAK
ncbi:MAG TPA: efflux RND transporter periplasmic adaptor subunit [Candidatus Angelobacter sp.]|nr:efflux RND transporter periplasmic adaptor subunit [Candidatus Angelobacter sp.]